MICSLDDLLSGTICDSDLDTGTHALAFFSLRYVSRRTRDDLLVGKRLSTSMRHKCSQVLAYHGDVTLSVASSGYVSVLTGTHSDMNQTPTGV